ncbi:MAG: hypothetical protein HC916_14400 [Coleofasciculaceae cyanobacterium SM2_1_6]|nr:hypothetical protein [Coleofasciculaceae cyanobacterium SM2_1_6]
MESLAYIHQSIAYADPQPAPKVVLWQNLNWQKPPSSAWLKFLWLSVIITAVVAISETAQAAAVKVQTNSGSGVYVRPEPSTATSPIGGLAEGAVVDVQASETSSWMRITSGAYKDAYIDGQWTVPVGSSTDSPASGTKFQVRTDFGLGLNVRALPSTSSDIVAGLGEGSMISIADSGTPGWAKIIDGSGSGYFVSTDWLVPVTSNNISTPTPSNNTSSAGLYAVKTNSGIGVKVRNSPSGAVIGGIGEGGRIDAAPSSTPGWAVITSGAYAGGYVADSWLVKSSGYTPVGSGSGGSAAAGLYAVKTNSGAGVKVRNSPSGAVIGGIGDGDTVNAASSGTPGWLVITSGAYAGGYISESWAIPIS